MTGRQDEKRIAPKMGIVDLKRREAEIRQQYESDTLTVLSSAAKKTRRRRVCC